jgi:VWFA-related protein
MMRRFGICVICGLGGMAAQNVPFRVQTKVVQVPVSVADKHGRNVEGLTARDFRVLDDGVPQEITVDDFGTGLPPISLAIAVQTSGISTPALTKIRRIGSMIQPLVLGQRGEAALVTFDSEIRWMQDFTPDDSKIRDAITKLQPSWAGEARMLDAIAAVTDRMKERQGRKVLLLISETRDRGSATGFRKAMEAVERQGIEVFGAHYSAYATSLIAKPKDLPKEPPQPTSGDPADWAPSSPGIDYLKIGLELARLGKTKPIQMLTRATGGSDYPFLKERGIENSIEKLGVEVHNQYILSFPQRGNASGLHQIEVSVPDHGDLQIRSRRTYWAD